MALQLKPLDPELELISKIRPPIRIKKFLPRSSLELLFPIQLKQMTKEETIEYHLKNFAEWGKKWEQEQKAELVFGVDGNIYRNGKLLAEEPDYFQKLWIIRRMRGPAKSWKRWSE